MKSNLVLISIAAVRLVHSAAVSTGLVARQATAADCPGYRASGIAQNATGFTANLTLAGAACNVYGRDVENLKLSVNFDHSMYLHIQSTRFELTESV
jgi:alpha-glucosidase